MLSGSGNITGKLTLNSGTVSPGNSPGTMTVGSLVLNGGSIRFDMNSASGTAGGGTGWDLLNNQGTALLAGNVTLDLVSLSQSNTPGNVFDFDPTSNYQWTFLHGPVGIGHLNSAQFLVDTSGFTNSYSGHFFVSQVGTNTVLNYVVPEPSSIVLLGIAMVGLLTRRWRQRDLPGVHRMWREMSNAT